MSETVRPKAKYKTTNWASYNAALKARGSLTIWLDRDMQWLATPSGKRGRQPNRRTQAWQSMATGSGCASGRHGGPSHFLVGA